MYDRDLLKDIMRRMIDGRDEKQTKASVLTIEEYQHPARRLVIEERVRCCRLIAHMIPGAMVIADEIETEARIAQERERTKTKGGAPSITFTNCNFGNVTEEKIRAWILRALEEDSAVG